MGSPAESIAHRSEHRLGRTPAEARATLTAVEVALPLSLPALSDGVVILRAFAEEDAPALAAIWRDPAIRARNEVPEPSEEAARAWVARSAGRAADGKAWEWAIVDARSGELAGRRALKDIDWAQQRAVAATWVGPRFRGRRFAARSLRLAAAYAFENGLVRVHAECDTDNEASMRSMLAAGMRHEGTLRAYFISEDGVPVDQHVLGMLREDLVNAPPLSSHDAV
jgi:RimJ/RimL family protein N-acetyltransferase